MDYVLIVDKPQGLTCQQVLNRFKKHFRKIKIGYTGTLDSFATGVLPVFLGKTTKLIPFICEDQKLYEATLRLGQTSDTLDHTGILTDPSPIPSLNETQVQQVLQSFLGSQTQIPPIFSAIKVSGKPLHRYARKGQDVELKPRPIEVFSIELLTFETSQICFRAQVSRGTYIRSLARDIAVKLGTVGHLTALRRLVSGSFHLQRVLTLSDLEKETDELIRQLQQMQISIPQLLPHFPILKIQASEGEWVKGLLNGKTIFWEEDQKRFEIF